MDSETIKYVLNVFIMVVIIFGVITMIDIISSHYKKEAPHEKKLLAVVTMEGLNNNNDNNPNLDVNININMKKGDSFCKHNMGSSSLNESCGKLTKRNCNSTSCCVWLSVGERLNSGTSVEEFEEKCAAGGQGGPTFNTDDNGKTKDIDYYYYQNKCYGKKCPT